MGLQWIAALTGAEFFSVGKIEKPIAWMACHFSGYGQGLSNLPQGLPDGSVLILDDSSPINGHDPALIFSQLESWAAVHRPSGILLDLQRPGNAETENLVNCLLKLPCTVAVSQLYAQNKDCPVFLSPVPPHRNLREHLAPWENREIWLEAALETEIATIAKGGSTFEATPLPENTTGFFPEKSRHMCYRVQLINGQAKITMVRNKDHISALLAEAEELGVKKAIGLYQQFGVEI